MTRDKAIETIKSMPEKFELEVLMERLVFMDKVEKGLEQLRNGESSSHEEVKKMVEQWRK
ncbi:MAG: hypothetical protein JST90_10535 [Bacteroidetes bacterium]|nr:hypothetical protein [Bacteroidota bacterium]